MEKKLFEYFRNFESTDFYGFAKLVGVDSDLIRKTILQGLGGGENSLKELIIACGEEFSNLNLLKKKKLLKLAKDVSKENLSCRKKVW